MGSTHGALLEGLVGDCVKEIVMRDSAEWQSGRFGCFKEIIRSKSFWDWLSSVSR